MEKVRFGIIGAGNMGTSHCMFFDKGRIENGVLTAIADINPQKIEILKSKINVQAEIFYSAEELINSGKVDAVIIATPHYQHPDLTIKALNAGLHVVCEKPAGVHTKHVKEMNEVARKSDKLFTVMFNQRTNSLYKKIRELVKTGAVGNIKRINWIITTWYRPQSYYDSGSWRATWAGEGGGVLINQCPHQLDLLPWITDMMPKRVRAFCHFGKWHDIEVEDDVTAYLEYENGATGVFITSTGDCPGTNRLEILGDMGKLVCENNGITYKRLKVNERVFNATNVGFGEPPSEYVAVEHSNDNPQHVGILNNFANAILKKEPLFVDGTEGLKSVELMNAMLLSTWLDKTVELPLDDELYLEELNKRAKASRYWSKQAEDKVFNTENTY